MSRDADAQQMTVALVRVWRQAEATADLALLEAICGFLALDHLRTKPVAQFEQEDRTVFTRREDPHCVNTVGCNLGALAYFYEKVVPTLQPLHE